jgi:mono/diheme cytochrome c family protein
MPAYRTQMNDQEIAELLSFVRQSWSNNQGPVAATDVQKMRQAGQ